MKTQLTLFDQPANGNSLVLRARKALAGNAQRFEDFSWWCRQGNRSMCAAVLVKRGMTPVVAAKAVNLLGESA